VVDVALELGDRSEVKEDAYLEVRRSQIADELHSISPGHLLCRLVLDDYTIINNHIQPLPTHVFSLVPNVDYQLANHDVSTVTELMLERTGINTLAHAITKILIHGEETTNDGVDPVSLE
jgi:hypothetical protein